MHLRPSRHSDQHELLLEHEKEGRIVNYVSPRFHGTRELNEHYLANRVWFRSLVISPMQIGDLPDDGEHCIAYEPDTDRHEFQSQPRSLSGKYDGGEALRRMRGQVPKSVTLEDMESRFTALAESMLAMVRDRRLGKSAGPELNSLSNRSAFAIAAYLSRVFFDSELFVVARQE
jgi:hypothetical protein